MEKIGWIGLGKMGVPMVRNLSGAGYPVVAYNRTTRPVDLGRTAAAASIQGAVTDAESVIFMVSDAQAIRELLFGDRGAIEWMRPGTLLVGMSTIGVDETKQLALELSQWGLEWMDAPVVGSVKPAEDGQLVVLAGGSDTAFRRMEPVFAAMSKQTFHLGPTGSGAAMKLCVNSYLAMTLQAAGECMVLADKTGPGRESFLEVLSTTAAWSGFLEGKRKMWESDEYPAAFSLKHMVKDLGLATRHAASAQVGLPALWSTHASFVSAGSHGLSESDMASVAKFLANMVGAQ